MEQRASITPDLPHAYPTASFWQDPPSQVATHQSTPDLPATVPVIIIGSGITGASIAYNLLSQANPPSILMLEARGACSGATGRNGGHTKCVSYRAFVDNVAALGEEEAAKIVRFEYDCMKAVHAFARTHHISCDSREGDTVDIIYDEGQWIKAQKGVEQIRRVLGVDDPAAQYTFWTAGEAEDKFLCKGAMGAVTYEAGSISAYKFVSGILKLCLDKGLNLQTQTAATCIMRENRLWTVETARGTIRAEKVILATNGYTAHLLPVLQGIIVPLRGHVTAQRPGSKMPKDGLATTYSFIYNDGYEYMITRPPTSTDPHDIIIGGGLTKTGSKGLFEFGTTDDTKCDLVITNYLENCTANFFNGFWGDDDAIGRTYKAWSGIMGYSADGFPLVGQVPDEDGLYIAASFQGSGMILSFSCAEALVQMVSGLDTEELGQRFPKSFQFTKVRLGHKFSGRLHTAKPKDRELKAL